MTSITCPRCGRTVTTRGVSHSGQPEGQWECSCGCIVDGGAAYYGGRSPADRIRHIVPRRGLDAGEGETPCD